MDGTRKYAWLRQALSWRAWLFFCAKLVPKFTIAGKLTFAWTVKFNAPVPFNAESTLCTKTLNQIQHEEGRKTGKVNSAFFLLSCFPYGSCIRSVRGFLCKAPSPPGGKLIS